MMRILVTDGMDQQAVSQLRANGHEVVEQFYEPDQLGEALREFDKLSNEKNYEKRKSFFDKLRDSMK